MLTILDHFFELPIADAKRTLHIYQICVELANDIVGYFSIAGRYKHVSGLDIPKFHYTPFESAERLHDYIRGHTKAIDDSNQLSKPSPDSIFEPREAPKSTDAIPTRNLTDFSEPGDQDHVQADTDHVQVSIQNIDFSYAPCSPSFPKHDTGIREQQTQRASQDFGSIDLKMDTHGRTQSMRQSSPAQR